MERPEQKPETDASDAVAEYKRILSDVLDRRPSGTRQRLATALGKNRSFISQISSEAYTTPIPFNHVETIFEICHFSQVERRKFLEAYAHAHPRRPAVAIESHRLKAHTVYLPDLGTDSENAKLHHLIGEFIRGLTRIVEEGRQKDKRR
jgi:hypothetical protein